MALVNKVKEILKAPFVGSLDLKGLFWLVGAVLIIATVWAFILSEARGITKEII